MTATKMKVNKYYISSACAYDRGAGFRLRLLIRPDAVARAVTPFYEIIQEEGQTLCEVAPFSGQQKANNKL
jgi:hypothetical protein